MHIIVTSSLRIYVSESSSAALNDIVMKNVYYEYHYEYK